MSPTFHRPRRRAAWLLPLALLLVGAGCVPEGPRRAPADLFALHGAADSYHERLAFEQALAMHIQLLDGVADKERRFRSGDAEPPSLAERAALAAVAELTVHRLADLATELPLTRRIKHRLAAWHRDLPFDASQALLRVWAQLHRQAGNDAGAAATQARRGCLLAWRAAGPFGKMTLADHDLPFAPELPRVEAGGPVAATGVTAARALPDAARCRVVVDGPEQRSGIYYLRTQVTLARPTWALLRVSGDDPFRVDVGTRTALDLDRRRGYLPVDRTARVLLGAGTTDLTIKVAAQGAESSLSAFLTDEAGGPLPSTAVAALGSAGRLATGSWVGPWRSPWSSPFGCDPEKLVGPAGVRTRPALACLQRARGARGRSGSGEGRAAVIESPGTDGLLAQLVRQDGETDLLRPLLEQLLAQRPADGALLQLRGESWLEDPSLGTRVARDRARKDLEEALRYEPWRARARFVLGTLEAQETGRTELALAHLERAAEETRRFEPHGAYSLWLQRHEIYREKGWEREARETLAEARKLNPAGCRVIELQADQARERGDLSSVERHLADLARCEPGSTRLADRARDRGEPARALALYQRLLARPEAARNGSGTGYDELVIEAAQMERALGRSAEAATRLRRRLAVRPRSLGLRRALADALIELGQRDQAVQVVSEALTLRPTADELRQPARTLGLAAPLEAHRLDGRAVIRDYEARASGRAPGSKRVRRARRAEPEVVGEASGAAVYLLDRTVVRVYPDGASVQLVHNIIKVLSKAGADKHGEVEIPEHAEVLTLRTVKSDGRSLEPESIPAKETVSVPDLHPGDHVEFEYQELHNPREVLGKGYLSERFYFRTFDAPLDRSEFVVIAPAGVTLDEDVRGDVEVVRQRQGELVVNTYRRRQNARLLPEPAAPGMEDFVPSVRVSARVTWDGWARQLRADALATARQNHELRKLAATLAAQGGAAGRGRLQTALRSYAWVTRNIEGKGDDGATASLSRRAGNRLALLRALLEAQGIPYDLLYARPHIGEVVQAQRIPEPELYSAAFLRVRDERGRVLDLDPRWRHAPPGFLAPTLSRARALLVPERPAGTVSGARWETLPPLQSRGAREVNLRATVAADGSASVEGREVLTGWPALEWRETLAQSDLTLVEKSFEERGLAGAFPGATLESLSFEGRENPAAPLLIKYRFKVSRLARREGRDLVLPGAYFPAKIAPAYASLQTRTLPLEIGVHPKLTVRTELVLPPGAQPLPAPGPAEAREAFGGVTGIFQLSVQARPAGLTVESILDLPPTRVRPPGYAAFARWARTIDHLETRELRVRLK